MEFSNLTQILNKGLIGEPALLLGLIVFIGLLLERRPFIQVLNGTIKVMIGYILLQLGAYAAGSSLSHLSVIIQNGFQIIGIIPHNETITAFIEIEYGHDIALIMLIGMSLHMLIAKYTHFKYIFLTGHHILFMAALLSGVIASFPLHSWQKYFLGGLILALCLSIGPAITQPYIKKVTKDNQFAIGHFNSIGYILAGSIATAVKSKTDSKLLKKVKKIQPFFQDQMITITVFTFTLFITASLFTSSLSISELFSGRHFIVISIIQAVWFASGVYIILHGVRLMLVEIIPSFHGIAQRVVPGAIPAMDAPVLLTYSPIAGVLGFLLSFLGGVFAMTTLILTQYTVIIPGIIPHFFCGGAAGVIAYKLGKGRGLVVATICHGFFITIVPSLLLPALSDLGFVRATFADSDFSIVGVLLYHILKIIFN